MLMPIAAVEGLRGSVKDVEAKTVSVFITESGTVEQIESTSSCRLNESNNLIEVEYSIPDKYSTTTINKFDSVDRLIETISYFDGSLKHRQQIIYDEQGLIIERRFYDENNNLSVQQPEYTNNGLRIEEAIYEPYVVDGKSVGGSINYTISPDVSVSFSHKNVYKTKAFYDSEDKLKEVSFYNRKNKLTGEVFVIYNSDRKPILITTFGNDTSFLPNDVNAWQILLYRLIFSRLLKMDTAFRLAVRKEFKKAAQCFIYGAPFEETLINYDEQEEKSIEIKRFSTILNDENSAFIKYDEKGNKLFDPLVQKYEYEYDSQDNWIKRKAFYKLAIDGTRFMERTILTYRKISYY